MVQSAEEFFNFFKKKDLEHIACNLDIEYESGIYKSDLVELIISVYLLDGRLNKRRIKKILNMFHKYEIKYICTKLGGEDFSGLNSEELKEYIANLSLSKEESYEDDDYNEVSDERLALHSIIDKITENYKLFPYEYRPEYFLEFFLKDNLKHIATQHSLEYTSSFSKYDLKNLIIEYQFSTEHYMTRKEIRSILDLFYKYQLEKNFSKICDYNFSQNNSDEIKDLIADHFLSKEDYYEDSEDEFEEYSESEDDDEEYFDTEDDEDSELEDYSANNIKILLCGAQPENTSDIELMKEYKMIGSIIRSFPLFKLNPKFHITLDELIQDLSDFKPHLLHITAHGTEKEILLEDEFGKLDPIEIDSIMGIINILNNESDSNKLIGIIFSSCQSAEITRKLVKTVQFVIAMSDIILVDSAIQFIGGFYSGLKSCLSIKGAFDLGIHLIKDKSQKDIPKLLLQDPEFGNFKLIKRNS